MDTVLNTPVIPLPNPGEGGAVESGEATPVVPLPNPGEGGAVANPEDGTPVIPLPNPGEGVPAFPGPSAPSLPILPLPDVNQGGPVYPTYPGSAAVRFLNAAYGYPPLRIFVGNTRVVNTLSFSSISTYNRYPVGYQTITVSGLNGYVYLQKSMPFYAGNISTIAIVNRAGGLDLTQINDVCCTPSGFYANFRVCNLAYNSDPMDVLLGDGRVVFADVRFKETTTFKRIVPGAYEFTFAPTSLMPMPTYADIETLDSAFIGMAPVSNPAASLYLNVRRYANYTVFLLSSGVAANAIQAIVIEDR